MYKQVSNSTLYIQRSPTISININFKEFSDVDRAAFTILLLSLALVVAHVYLLPPTPEKSEKFIHVEMVGGYCRWNF